MEMRQPITLMYSCNHPSTSTTNNHETDLDLPPQHKILPMTCYTCVQARLSSFSITMSGALTDTDFTQKNTSWIQTYDKEAEILTQHQASALAGVRDFGLENAAHLAAREVVQSVLGLDEVEDEGGELQEEEEEEEDEEECTLKPEEKEVREMNGRLIIPGHGLSIPMKVVRERRSAPTVADGWETEEVAFRRRFLAGLRGEVKRQEDVNGRERDLNGREAEVDERGGEVNGHNNCREGAEEIPGVAYKKKFLGGLKGLRDGAIARLGFRKDEKKVVERDEETDQEILVLLKKD